MIEITPQAEKVRRAWLVAEDAYTDVISRSEECMRYVLNDPYSEEDKTNAQTYKKPLLKYNIMIPYLATLIGNEQLSRRRALIKTRSTEPVQMEVVSIVQGRWNAINDEQNVEEKIQTAFSDALIMPVGGYIVRSFVMNEEGYLDYHYEVANNMRIKLDPETKSSDQKLEKCRWLIKEGWERPEYIMDKWNVAAEDFEDKGKLGWWERVKTYYKRFKDSTYSGNTDYDEDNDLFRILEMQERTMHRFVRVGTDEGMVLVPKDEYPALRKANPQNQYLGEIEKEIIHITTIVPALNNLLVVDEDSKVPTSNFDVFRINSYAYSNQVTEEISMIYLLMDPSDDINKGKSQNRDYISQALAGGRVIHGSHEKELYEEMVKRGNQAGQVYIAKNPNTKITELGPQSIQSDLMNNTIDSLMHGDRITQSTAAMRGESEKSGESGKLFAKKVDRAAAAINPYYKNISNLRKAIVEDYVDNFSYVYSEYDRLVDVKSATNKQGENTWDKVFINLKMASEVVNDVRNVSMYVELDEGEDNITAKEEEFNQLMALTEVVGNLNPALVDIVTVLEAAPMKLAPKMAEYAKAIIAAQSDEAEGQKQIENEKLRLENATIAKDLTKPEEVKAQG